LKFKIYPHTAGRQALNHARAIAAACPRDIVYRKDGVPARSQGTPRRHNPLLAGAAACLHALADRAKDEASRPRGAEFLMMREAAASPVMIRADPVKASIVGGRADASMLRK
jgi:hypothetical protein